MEITEIHYNWYYTTNEGEDYTIIKLGERGVKKIIEHRPQGDGDNWYCEIEYTDGTLLTVANLNKVVSKPLSV